MIINYGIEKIIPFIKCNEVVYGPNGTKPLNPVYLQSKQLNRKSSQTTHALIPYGIKQVEVYQDIEETKRTIFGKKVVKHSVPITKYEPDQTRKGIAFVASDNRSFATALCWIPYSNSKDKIYLKQYKKNKWTNDSSSYNYSDYRNVLIGINSELLMPLITHQPQDLESAKAMVRVDPRFLKQLDPQICASDEDMDSLLKEAQNGYNNVLSYQSDFGIAPSESELKEQQAYKHICDQYAYDFQKSYKEYRNALSSLDS